MVLILRSVDSYWNWRPNYLHNICMPSISCIQAHTAKILKYRKSNSITEGLCETKTLICKESHFYFTLQFPLQVKRSASPPTYCYHTNVHLTFCMPWGGTRGVGVSIPVFFLRTLKLQKEGQNFIRLREYIGLLI